MNFQVGNRTIGDGHPCFVIAEIGCNHNGSFDLAKDHINAAKEAGVDAVKFQVKDVETAFSKELLDSTYVNEYSFGKTYREHKQSLELSHQQYADLKEYTESSGMIFFATPFELKSAKFLVELDVDLFKISSFHVVDTELIEVIAKSQKPVIMSTGMSSLEEIDQAVSVFNKNKITFALLQCTSSYPTNEEDMHLSAIPALRNKYNCIVGLSAHDRGISVAAASVMLDSKIIEKHFTLDRTMKGRDHAFSLEPKGMKLMVEKIRLFEKSIGNPEKRVLDCELSARKKNRGY